MHFSDSELTHAAILGRAKETLARHHVASIKDGRKNFKICIAFLVLTIVVSLWMYRLGDEEGAWMGAFATVVMTAGAVLIRVSTKQHERGLAELQDLDPCSDFVPFYTKLRERSR